MLDNQNRNRATIDNSTRIPDYFSCQQCIAGPKQYTDTCRRLRQEGACRALMLARALETGAVSVHIHMGTAPESWRVGPAAHYIEASND